VFEARSRRVPAESPQASSSDMFCYRRHLHNEGRARLHPAVMYRRSLSHPSTLGLRQAPGTRKGVVTKASEKAMADGGWARYRVEAGTGYKQKGRLVDGNGLAQDRRSGRGTSPRRHRRRYAGAQGDGRKITRLRRIPGSTAPWTGSGKSLKAIGQGVRASIGDRRGARGLPLCRKAISAESGRIAKRGTFRSGIRSWIDQEDEAVTPVKYAGWRAGPLRRHQLDALREDGGRLRIRLFARPSRMALAMWEAQFRRLRQRSAGVVRSILSPATQRAAHVGIVCLCRTAMRARDRNIRLRGSSVLADVRRKPT